ncbi:MAG: hypothetical protein IJR68_01540, partial [Fretibacterium sp.]|nr:hypothetical protein [Fretibacterium sp.]
NDQDLQDILEGRADFICTLKDTKVKSAQTKAPKAPVDEAAMSEWKDKLYSFSSTAEGVQYLKQIKELTLPILKQFADYLGSPLPSRGKKDDLIVWLVDHTLGGVLNRKGIRQS